MSKIKLSDIQNLVTDFEGALAEQFVGQELLSTLPQYPHTQAQPNGILQGRYVKTSTSLRGIERWACG